MNYKNPAIKRILADVRELERHPSSRYSAAPLEENFFEWHFTIRGPSGSDFDGGKYHGRILLSPEYPFKPPNIVFLTKNGRFEVGTKICLSISAYHEESWQPAWGVRTMLEAIISFMPSEGNGAIGALDWTKLERQRLAKESHNFCCSLCGPINKLLSEPKENETDTPSADITEQISQLRFESKTGGEDSSAKASTKESSDKDITPIIADDERKPAYVNPAPAVADVDHKKEVVMIERTDDTSAEIKLSQSDQQTASNVVEMSTSVVDDEKQMVQNADNLIKEGYIEDSTESYVSESSSSSSAGTTSSTLATLDISARRKVSVKRITQNNLESQQSINTSSVSQEAAAAVQAQAPIDVVAPGFVGNGNLLINQPVPPPVNDWVDQMLGGAIVFMDYIISYLTYKEVAIIFFGHYFE